MNICDYASMIKYVPQLIFITMPEGWWSSLQFLKARLFITFSIKFLSRNSITWCFECFFLFPHPPVPPKKTRNLTLWRWILLGLWWLQNLGQSKFYDLSKCSFFSILWTRKNNPKYKKNMVLTPPPPQKNKNKTNVTGNSAKNSNLVHWDGWWVFKASGNLFTESNLSSWSKILLRS